MSELSKAISTNNRPGIKDVATDINFYMVLVAYGIFVLRIQTFIAWLSGGWPEWVVDDQSDPNNTERKEEFNQRINTLNSILAITLIVLNAIPGRNWNYPIGFMAFKFLEF